MSIIIAIATRRIDDSLPTNVQHLMIRLARHFQVLYIEPAVDLLFLLRKPKFLTRFCNSFGRGRLKCRIPVILPFENRFRRLREINHKIISRQIRLFARSQDSDVSILWLFSPKHAFLIGQLGETKRYFHVTDDYSAFPQKAGLGPPSEIRSQEDFIVDNVDRVFVTSPYLAALKSKWSVKMEVIPNVADTKHFGKALCEDLSVPPEIECIRKPVVGFVGAIDSFKIDFELLRYCAENNSDLSFVMIGPVGRGDETSCGDVPRGTNLHYLGERPYARLPNYIKAFDVCLIPYRITGYTRSCFPLKLHEYLAAGKPVVSTRLPAVAQYADVVYMAESGPDFNRCIRQALAADSPELARIRHNRAQAHSWERRVEVLQRIISEDFGMYAQGDSQPAQETATGRPAAFGKTLVGSNSSAPAGRYK